MTNGPDLDHDKKLPFVIVYQLQSSTLSRVVTIFSLGLMQYTRDPICFTSRPVFSQPEKKIDSSSFPILRLQLIRNAGAGNPMAIPGGKQ